MGNYKFIEEVIDKYVRRKKPFLIIKYGTTFLDRANNIYEVVTIGAGKLRYMPIERRVALDAIDRYEIPLLHSLDSRNMIWGDENFKKQFKERRIEL